MRIVVTMDIQVRSIPKEGGIAIPDEKIEPNGVIEWR